jgi:hypothetical protein
MCMTEQIGDDWRSWVRHCTTSQNVVGSIPDRETGFSFTQSFWLHYDTEDDSASNIIDNQDYYLGDEASGE